MSAEKETQTSENMHSRRSRILAAAANLFAQQGFDGTSIGAIALAANVNKSLVQYHFDNKEKLWQEAIRQVWQQRNEALPDYLQQSMSVLLINEEQMVRELCRSILQFTFDQPQWVKLMLQEASTPGPRLDWMVDNFFKEDFQSGTAMLEIAQKRGLLPDVNVIDLLHILSGALIYLVNVAEITQRVLGVNPSSEEYINQHIDTLMYLLQPKPR
jgi:AcrR family transcriptional regulator